MGKDLAQQRDTEVGDSARWPRVRLGDVCEVVLGGTPRTAVDAYWGGSIPWLTPGEMGKILGPYVENTKRKLTEEGLNAGSSLFPSRSVILSTRAPIGYVFINRVPMCTNQGCKTLVPSSEVWPEYLYFYLLGRTDELNQLGTGTTFKELATGALKGIEIPLPPLPVQHEIVARLERELGAVDKLAKKFEELEAAAEAEFKAELKETFEEIKHRGTETRRLGDVARISYGYTAKASPDTGDGSPKYLRITDIQNQSVDWNRVPTCDCPEIEEYRLKAGDIVFARTGATTGKSFLIKGNVPLSVYASYLIRVQLVDLKEIDLCYLWYSFDTPDYWALIQCGMAGAAQGGFNSKKLSNLEIPLPSLLVQREVVARLDAAKAKKEKLVAAARRGRETAALMRKAILKEAFE